MHKTNVWKLDPSHSTGDSGKEPGRSWPDLAPLAAAVLASTPPKPQTKLPTPPVTHKKWEKLPVEIKFPPLELKPSKEFRKGKQQKKKQFSPTFARPDQFDKKNKFMKPHNPHDANYAQNFSPDSETIKLWIRQQLYS
jgi:hypothetical protein